ncbi:hypothetical protein IJD34_00825 [bacterium]|nr:hypothetical protein [bacterium]
MFINALNNSTINFEKRRVKFHTGKLHDGFTAVSEKTKRHPMQNANKNKALQNRYEREVLKAYNNDPSNRVRDGLNKLESETERLEQEYYHALMGIDINHSKVTKQKFK